ncbi:MAG: PspC domain-containing protein [Rubrivivax sp.]|jgi:phage shock protein PspC (stress-responsive transcriptional regulator)|nr:PspC domain-containing protein [Rubrivivax sp.]
MSLVDELARLEDLRARGALTEDEFRRAKARLLDGSAPGEIPAVSAVGRLRRSRSDRWIGGVCGGIAVASGVESWIWRLLFAVLFLFGGTGLVVYLLLWLFVPNE